MVTITLQRKHPKGKAVPGKMTIPFNANCTLTMDSLENADYLIPAGTYQVDKTYSPKFRKMMPVLLEVPNREGIRIHGGTKPEHSTGCILVPPIDMANVNLFIDNQKFIENEEIFIRIIDA